MLAYLWRQCIACLNNITAKERLWISRHYALNKLTTGFCDPRGIQTDKDPPDLIAGADVGFEQGGEVTRAAMVLLKYPSLELVEYKVARIATTMP